MKRIIFFLCSLSVLGANATVPLVTVNEGRIEGFLRHTIKGREIAAFEGVPYAEAPVDELRFEPPKPKKPWLDVWKANTVHTCLQYSHENGGAAAVKGNEDCLYLNIYRPNDQSLNNMDVIFYIHGGAFMFNNGGSNQPIYLLDKDVVLISINYRLGPLGFLSLEDKVLPGNNGLKDQALALKWVKANIHYFGGNPNSITITGMSAGSASVHLHTLSPSTTGLFHRVIAQSGVALNPWVLVENAKEKAHELATLLGCSTTYPKRLLKCLKSRPGQQIMENVKYFQKYLYNPFTPFGPVIEKPNKDAFLVEHPLLIMKKKQVKNVPILFSFVACEGLYPAADFVMDPKYLDDIDQNWDGIMPYVLHYDGTVSKEDMNDVSRQIRETYLKDKQVKMETYDDLVQSITDRLFVKDIADVALLQSKAISSPVYSYKLSYLGVNGLGTLRAPGIKFNCTSHADDTFYVLPPWDFMRTIEEDAKMSDAFIEMWTSFARTGVPVMDNTEWLPVTKTNESYKYLHIESPESIQMESEDNLAKANFWNSLPIMENEKLFKLRQEL